MSGPRPRSRRDSQPMELNDAQQTHSSSMRQFWQVPLGDERLGCPKGFSKSESWLSAPKKLGQTDPDGRITKSRREQPAGSCAIHSVDLMFSADLQIWSFGCMRRCLGLRNLYRLQASCWSFRNGDWRCTSTLGRGHVISLAPCYPSITSADSLQCLGPFLGVKRLHMGV